MPSPQLSRPTYALVPVANKQPLNEANPAPYNWKRCKRQYGPGTKVDWRRPENGCALRYRHREKRHRPEIARMRAPGTMWGGCVVNVASLGSSIPKRNATATKYCIT